MTTDKIGNMLTVIRNANQRKHYKLKINSSKLLVNITEILKKEGYIQDYKISDDKKPVLTIYLKYVKDQRVIRGLKRISKPGLRVYTNHKNLPKVLNGLGLAIISTPKGVMSDKEAREQKLGGEVVAYVW